MHVVGEACDAESALAAVAATNPDVAVLELELEPLGPLRLMQRFGVHSNVRLVLLAGTDDHEIVEAALTGGARAIVSKKAPMAQLLEAIRTAAHGAGWTPPRLEAQMTGRDEESQAWASLTPRERDVAGLVAQGLPYKKVAEQLAISDHTVKNHLRSIYDKLDINSRVELAVHAAADRP